LSANLGKSVKETLAMIRQAFGEECETGEEQVKSRLIIFLDIKGIVRKEFVLAGQTVNSA
jgi:hypothetical protein